MQLNVWTASSYMRMFPGTLPQKPVRFTIDAARNEPFSFQTGIRLGEGERTDVRIEAEAPSGMHVRVRRIGYVPVLHHNPPVLKSSLDRDGKGCIPGYVPDPLFDEQTILLPPEETHAFRIDVDPAGVKPGCYSVRVTALPKKGRAVTRSVRVRIHDVVLEKRRDFNITHWFYADALIDWYRTDLFDRRFWRICRAYMRDAAGHGQDTIYVPVFTPPLDGVKRPTQLLHVQRSADDVFRFQWKDVQKYIRTARKCGITHFEWCHPFTQWGAENAIRVYEGQGRGERLLWKPSTGAVSKTYRAFLSRYLSRLRRFLEDEHITETSFFHVSDEPHSRKHLRNYKKARALVRDIAPWMKVMDALSDIEFARQGLTDMPVAGIRTALQFIKEGISCWCYYCCGPRGEYLNRLMDTPLAKIAMHGFLLYRWPFKGFLHWGYNYWYESQTRNLIDPYTVQDGKAWYKGWAYGDPFVVYPGTEGPVDSVRWEVFAESMNDYRLLQTCGTARNDHLLAHIRSFSSFPKTEQWRRNARRALFGRLT